MPRTILLIDDDLNFLSIMKMSLESEGYNVIATPSPVAGLQKMNDQHPDILIVDWEMPEMNGIELIKIVKRDPVHGACHTIMVTGRSTTDNIIAGLDAGADDYLIKPFQIEEMLARVRSGLRVRSLEERIAEEAKKLTVLEMALSVADKVGNPVAAAKLHQQILQDDSRLAAIPDIMDSLKSIGSLLDDALDLINQYQSIKNPRSVPAPGGRTMIAPE
jgi:sigma-B regulation protein RsbU (phosphoserine phosphatase)